MAQARRLLGVSRAFCSALRAPSFATSMTITRSFTDCKLFVGGLSFRTTEDGLKSSFAVHGEVCDVRIISDRETGRSRGFGFVTFYNESDAENALAKLNGQVLDGRTIRVDRASEKGRGGSSFPALSTELPEPPQDEDWGSIPSLAADIPGLSSPVGGDEVSGDMGSFDAEQDSGEEIKV